ncbi:origin recognition complex subunit 3-like isoform 2 [Planoprotostelium fungivorum]|uniref:Origin recognition complex subunit 3-like isoform 2 n=1 Tax=Planoprotostelium fungivorum TaxID=1890364 RepID=A0A2P6NJR0_9EUKA|nr:origin recognition complex subunit 3-like isoform 2 [Planoprotostelium fungivorum]
MQTRQQRAEEKLRQKYLKDEGIITTYNTPHGRSWGHYFDGVTVNLVQKSFHMQSDEFDDEDFVDSMALDDAAIKRWNRSIHTSVAQERKKNFKKGELRDGCLFSPITDGVEEGPKACQIRYNMYRSVIDKVDQIVKRITVEADGTILEQIKRFIMRPWHRSGPILPTAIVNTNASDRTSMADRIAQSLESSPNFRVAHLQSKKSIDARQIYTDMVSQLLHLPTKESSRYPNNLQLLNDELEDLTAVLVFDDLDAFNPKTLHSFIEKIKEAVVNKVPKIVFVMFTSSTESIERVLPRETSCLLWIERFSMASSRSVFSDILTAVLLEHEELMIWLDHPSLSLLLSSFNNFSSVHICVQQLKYLLLKHFYENPLSGLRQVSEAMFDYTYRAHVTSMPKYRKRNPPKLELCLKKIDEWYLHWKISYRCLLLLQGQSTLPVEVLNVKRVSVQQLREWLSGLVHIVRDVKSMGEVEREWEGFYNQLQQREESGEKQKEDTEPIKSRGRMSARQRKQVLTDLADGDSNFKSARQAIFDSLMSFLKRNLSRVDDLHLSEGFVCTAAESVKKAFFADVSSSVHSALSNPSEYLYHYREGQYPAVIIYRLWKDSGKMINLQDLYEQYRQVVDPQGKETKDSVQAQFSQTLIDFKMVGLIHPTMAKEDHVVKDMY